ncbi:MAG: T9SS type A sorting domain-containing protein [Bacteroidota bacterium]
MLKIYRLFLLITLLGSFASAQSFNRTLNPFPETVKRQFSGNETAIKILAVMADFQEDKDDATIGNGKFGTMFSKVYGDTILDPLPHDRNYFSAHLQFAVNYFKKVSRGKVSVSYDLIESVFTASQRMRMYSVSKNSTDYTPLGNFSKEIWTQVKNNNPSIRFEDYDIFLIFHAGVGKDVSLSSDIGDTKDLPSIYLSDKTLRKIYGSDLSGLPVNRSGQVNSMIIPETESREISSNFGGTTLLELSTNGLIAASIASHMGLPDLFDTKTGTSAIDRFGLMDGQAIFTYGGTFPPEPSPWEKQFLGWETPVTVEHKDSHVTLAASNSAQAGDTTVVRIPLSSTEYYLVENRSRDAAKDGVTITYMLGGNTYTKHFPKDQKGFYYYDVNALQGVVTDVDDFNWASPKNGGIVVWHIDDKIIESKLESNSINANPAMRGVDVEEADGIQHIGESFDTVFGTVIGEADSVDYWFKGNKARFYKNVFSPASLPNTNLNDSSVSHITLSDFSPIDTRMSFNLSFGDNSVKNLTSVKISDDRKDISITALPVNFGSDEGQYPVLTAILIGKDLKLIDQSGNQVGTTITGFSNVKPATSENLIIGVNASRINYLGVKYNPSDKSYSFVSKSYSTDQQISGVPVIANGLSLYVPAASGKVMLYSIWAAGDSLMHMQDISSGTADPVKFFASGFLENAFATGRDVYYNSEKILSRDNIKSILFVKDPQSVASSVIVLSGKNSIDILKDKKLISSFNLNSADSISNISVANLENPKQPGIIFFTDSEGLKAVNFSGAMQDNFPFRYPAGFSGTPLVANVDFEIYPEVISYTNDGKIFAINTITGKVAEGYPISAGASVINSPVIYDYSNGRTKYPVLSAVTRNGYFTSWLLGTDSYFGFWEDQYGSHTNNPRLELSLTEDIQYGFFPANRAYNWPNPVYDGITYIRYYVDEDAKIGIRIFDLAGDKVAELNANARGGMDNEIQWNVSDVQSGIYFARIEAEGNSSGKKENTVIKIAVIK